MGEASFPVLQRIEKEMALPVSVEVASPAQVETLLRNGISCCWIGARTTVNPHQVAEIAVEWLKANEESMRILRYGYCLKTDNFSEQIITDSLAAVTERVKSEVVASRDGFAAVLQGVDDPWDVALVELWRREVDKSFSTNVKELDENGKLFG